MDIKKYKALYLFSGIGGGALGFQEAKEEYKGVQGTFETICGIDCVPEICQDFEYITGSRAECMDLFSREQYIDFHGKEPREDWREVSPGDIKKACRGLYPDVVFTSPPCKGFSGLLPEESAKTKKYQALNKLTIRGIGLVCEAFKDDLPSLILLENVPRITTRGKKFLTEIKETLASYGYLFSEGYHDCGEIGGLAQHRKRYLLIARNPKKLYGFVYEPFKQRVRAIGEVLKDIPLPDDLNMGAMHRLPRLQWKTWVRLALIPAGGDWRDLEEGNGNRHTSHFRIVPWEEASGTVTGASHVANGLISVQDIRLNERKKRYPGLYKVVKMDEPSPTIIGQTDIQCGALSIADVRINNKPRAGTYGVMKWDEPSKTVVGNSDIHAGCAAIGDIRIPKDTDRLDPPPVIIALDNTWHRPVTTLELALLQGLPLYIDGQPLKLSGKNDGEWRERIGNMVPKDAATAIGETMLRAMLPQEKNEMVLGYTPIWVRDSIYL